MALLLLTATITPPANALDLARSDPAERLQDYQRALSFYLGKLRAGVFEGIVFVDNSASDLSSLRRLAEEAGVSERVELIAYRGLDYPPHNGRAYGELLLLDHAMAHSRLVADVPPDTLVWKVTGRYIIENIERLTRPKDGAVLYCHCRNLPQRWADMYLLGWTKGAYAGTVQGAAERVVGGAEVAFRALVDEKARSMRVVRRFPEPPRVRGIRGWDARPYEADPLKTRIRAMLARAVPWLWI